MILVDEEGEAAWIELQHFAVVANAPDLDIDALDACRDRRLAAADANAGAVDDTGLVLAEGDAAAGEVAAPGACE